MEPVGLSPLLVDFGPVMNAQFIEMLLTIKGTDMWASSVTLQFQNPSLQSWSWIWRPTFRVH